MFYNTTHETPPELIRHRRKAQTQTEIVLAYFERYPHLTFTPSEIWELAFLRSCPLTSVRRSISDLTADGKLVKTTQQRLGEYGRNEYAWRLAGDQLSLF